MWDPRQPPFGTFAITAHDDSIFSVLGFNGGVLTGSADFSIKCEFWLGFRSGWLPVSRIMALLCVAVDVEECGLYIWHMGMCQEKLLNNYPWGIPLILSFLALEHVGCVTVLPQTGTRIGN